MQATDRRKVFFTTTFKLCDNNGYLSTQIHDFFRLNGHEMVTTPASADVIVISTCGFDQARENTSISIIDRYIAGSSSNQKVIICGCLTKINPDLFEALQVDLIGPKELYRFNEIFSPEIKIEEVSGSALNLQFIDGNYGFVEDYYLQIGQGCVNNCSYCAIKKAKGHVASKPIQTVIRELERGMEMGYSQFMLLGDDCASYGADIGVDLADLLNELTGHNIRLKINYVEPRGFQNLYPKINRAVFDRIDFINIPLQSTSRRILGLMNRNYEVAEITEMTKEIKVNAPHLFLETHLIYGFPSETHEEFQDGFRLTEFFDSVIYFYYTDRYNVGAALLPDKLSGEEIIHRTREIQRHPDFSKEHDTAEPPMVLLGYGLSESDLFKSIKTSRE